MPRANRLGETGGILHLTHRCHNRAFLLKFARDRDAYRTQVREHLQQYELALLDYCVTSNHVHLIVDAVEWSEVSGFMREVASEFARAYNRRKGRLNAFWGDNYHATLVEDGRHLWECLCYVELNMVRCQAVIHPREWKWLGYHEIMGERQRYRVVDLERLCWRLRAANIEEVRGNLAQSLDERIARRMMSRQPQWTESLAIGSLEFVKQVQPEILSRRETEIVVNSDGSCVLRETPTPYAAKSSLKIASNALNLA